MKPALLWSGALCGALALTGCPIYPDPDVGCFSDSDCGNAYYCHYSSGQCVPLDETPDECAAPADCPGTQTCSSDRTCRSGSCRHNGCVAGYRCDAPGGQWTCVPDARDAGATPDAQPPDASRPNDASADARDDEDAAEPDAAEPDATPDAAAQDAATDALSDAPNG